MRKIGFGDSITLKVLQDLCKYRFLHTASQNEADLSSSFFPTRLGGYVVRDLIAYFAFIENVLFDTFISNNATWEELRSLSHQIENERNLLARVKKRVERVQVFLHHINQLYIPLQQESRKRGLVTEWCSNPFADTQSKLQEELKRVCDSAEFNYGKNSKVNVGEIDEV